MTHTEISVFEITNLSEVSCRYKLYKILGLNPDSDEFDINMQLLVQNLSSFSRSPCIKIKIKGDHYIAQPETYSDLPSIFSVMKNETVNLQKRKELTPLDFNNLDDETINLAIRFLKFELQKSILANPSMWSPKAGAPFFNKFPNQRFAEYSDDIDLYRGFQCRLIQLPGNKIGIAVDTVTKYLSRRPLPRYITREDFNKKFKGARAVYEYGSKWYEIKFLELDTKTVSDKTIDNGKSLLETINEQYAGKTKSKLFAHLTPDCSVLSYLTPLNARRNVASVLCRLTHNTKEVKGCHKFSIDHPERKRQRLINISKNYLDGFLFNGIKVHVSPILFIPGDYNKLHVPAIEFGNNKILDYNKIDIKDFCRLKEHLLFSDEAGFYHKKDFDKQYIFLPNSVNDTYGKVFINDLIEEVNRIYSPDRKYNPEIITYDDTDTHSYIKIGRKIIETAKSPGIIPGKAVVMIPRFQSKIMKKEDKLANLVLKELSSLNISASIIHSDTSETCFHLSASTECETWQLVDDLPRRKLYSGYIKNVALNKVLLLNEITPFILHDRLTSDLVITIDVKNHNAGMTLMNHDGSIRDFITHNSRWREQLNHGQICQLLKNIIQKYATVTKSKIENILILRDGRVFDQEKKGVYEAITDLVKFGFVSSDCKPTFLEIRKTSMAPIRLFNVIFDPNESREKVRNSQNGTCFKIQNDAYVVTTGYPFYHRGTSVPLHIIYHGGGLDFNTALQDMFSLTHLTWTKIDYCLRVPLPIKLCDLRLREEAGDYDSDALEINIDEREVENE